MKNSMKWRSGLGAASTPERWVLLEAEHYAKSIAVQDECCGRFDGTDRILPDCSDIAVHSSRIKWGRKAGFLYIRITVVLRGAAGNRVFNWRKAMPKRRR